MILIKAELFGEINKKQLIFLSTEYIINKKVSEGENIITQRGTLFC